MRQPSFICVLCRLLQALSPFRVRWYDGTECEDDEHCHVWQMIISNAKGLRQSDGSQWCEAPGDMSDTLRAVRPGSTRIRT